MKDQSGIYKILNPINNKFYIGSSVNLRKRKHVHFSTLRTNKHVNKHLQYAFNKYACEFQFLILEVCSKDQLLIREQFYLDLLSPHYNKNPLAQSCLGNKRTGKQKQAMSDLRVKSVAQYSIDGDLIQTFRSAIDASKYLNKDRTVICKCCNNLLKTAYGYMWKYV